MTRFIVIVLVALGVMSAAANFAKDKGEELKNVHQSRIEMIEKAMK